MYVCMCVYEVCMYWILTPSTVLLALPYPPNLIQPLKPSMFPRMYLKYAKELRV